LIYNNLIRPIGKFLGLIKDPDLVPPIKEGLQDISHLLDKEGEL